jgi:tRNA (mo5U34)-methyltransferase
VNPNQVAERVQALGWYHSIDLGDEIVTPGQSVATPLTPSQLSDMRNRTVIDIGAWDGYYSFLAERCGASRVVALDHYAWGVDMGARQQYWAECAARGELPDHSRDLVDFWNPDLPGRAGFDLAREVLHSKVEPVVADFMTTELDSLGTFDVVLYLGVLYHIKEPLTALERVRRVTREVAVVETEAIDVAGYEDQELVRFVAGNEVNGDFGNWYVPSIVALRSLCRTAGFSRVETVVGPPPRADRTVVQRLRRPHARPMITPYRAVVRAFV